MSDLFSPKPVKTELGQPAKTFGDLSFIETQFPVSKMSIESYTERKAVAGQTLTSLGKWWGRKPLVLCRATILGLLLPATDDPQKDREIFLRLMTMDDDGTLRRKSANIPAKELFRRLPPGDRTRYFEPGSTEDDARVKRGLSKEAKAELQTRVFLSLSYDERLEYCDRPEQVDGPSPESWAIINAHLGTKTSSLPELVAELGKRRFGHVPRVGDAFCGGGSIPFEAARIGCHAYGSDLNPVAALLTWASINVVGGGPKIAEEARKVQREVYESVDRQITEWRIEHREPDAKTSRRWRADAFLYCTEVDCPECGWRVPLAASWVVAEKTNVIARLVPQKKEKRFAFEIIANVSEKERKAAADAGTAKDSMVVCPNCSGKTPVKVIRGDGRGNFGDSKSLLRGWENRDIAPRADDIFRERLYCIRWTDTWIGSDGDRRHERHYAAPTLNDLKREQRVIDLLQERFMVWQKNGFIPSRRIEPGYNTAQPIRERGWTHWHHLFSPRQLLVHGLLLEELVKSHGSAVRGALVQTLLCVGDCANWDSRLSKWGPSIHASGGIGWVYDTFYNQALNTFFNYGTRSLALLHTVFLKTQKAFVTSKGSIVVPEDCRSVSQVSDVWITDPPYADAVNYHELGEFFLAWYEKHLPRIFPDWYSDSKRALAVKGADQSFRQSMVECYRRLSEHMPADGMQVVMFTHQDASVWADLSMILWAAGLRVSAAWCVSTETPSSLREGNYVQGTVLLVLRKQAGTETAFLDEVYQEVESEVRRQLDTMRDLDDAKDPNFSDTDYQLAAYAAALRVLTSRKIEEIDVAYELTKMRTKGEKSPVEELIERAVKIACDHLVPRGIETHLWKSLTPLERLYLKGVELESHGERRIGVYQELARGFGVDEYTVLLASAKANETRLKTATEFGRKEMGDAGFGASIVRHALFAACKTAETDSPRDGITWLTTEVKDYKSSRPRVIEILEFLAAISQNASLPHWHKGAEAAGILAGALRNRQDNV